MIDEGYDVVIRLTPPPDSSLIVRSLATWRHVLCCSHAYLEKYGRPEQLSDLSERNCVRHVLYPYQDEWRFVDRKGAPASVRVSGNLISNSGETLRVAALHGHAISLAAGFLCPPETRGRARGRWCAGVGPPVRGLTRWDLP